VTERAVLAGLEWLARHQSPDGRWSLVHYASHLEAPSTRDLYHVEWSGRERRSSVGGSRRAARGDTAATGLALLAFLGRGESHTRDGPFRQVVARGLAWLLAQQQQRDGDLRGGGNLYMHAIAAFALCEAYAFTRDPALRAPAQAAIDFVARSQNPVRGGWRYTPYPESDDVDTSVFGWMVMALKSAGVGGLDVDRQCLLRAEAYLESARMSTAGGRYAYQPGRPRTSIAMTAQGFFSHLVLGSMLEEGRRTRFDPERASSESTRFLLANLPRAEDMEGVNFYYWYYSTLALYQAGGEAWSLWNERLSALLVALQVGEEEGTAAGSWDPRGERGNTGGRVYSTALCVLSLEVYYRYAWLEEAAGRRR
jgi:hypothetical protein